MRRIEIAATLFTLACGRSSHPPPAYVLEATGGIYSDGSGARDLPRRDDPSA
jgi:hypothetical protein